MDVWTSLARALDRLPSGSLTSPEGGRLGAALVLLGDPAATGDLRIVYTRRRDDLPTHPGQISFPGGRVDPGETLEQAALREAVEEVALDPSTVEILGRLPAFYIPPSRFWLQPVVARWRSPHPLTAAEAEVAEVVQAPLSTLRDPAAWRVVRLSGVGETWAWQLDDRHLLWGATAVVTTAVLDMVEPDWHGGAAPAGLPPDREVRPWETPARATPAPGRAWLPGLAERPRRAVTVRGSANGRAAPTRRAVAAASAGVAAAVAALAGELTTRRALVLAGAGGSGAVGLRAAQRLAQRGLDVSVVLSRPPDRLAPVAAEALPAGADVAVFDGTLPHADVVVDALVGSGLSGPLRGREQAMVLALRHHDVAILSVDLPTGLHPEEGLIGDCVAADVTVSVGPPRPGLFVPGLAPFVGDLYQADLDAGRPEALVRLVPEAAPGGWGE